MIDPVIRRIQANAPSLSFSVEYIIIDAITALLPGDDVCVIAIAGGRERHHSRLAEYIAVNLVVAAPQCASIVQMDARPGNLFEDIVSYDDARL